MTLDPDPAATSRPRIRVGIAGVTAYGGQEAARLLAGHPGFELVAASSDAFAGQHLGDLDRDLGPAGAVQLVGHNDTVAAARDGRVELMLVATSPQQAVRLGGELLGAGVRVIDLSGGFRLRDPEAHVTAYGFWRAPEAAAGHEAVYGLAEHTAPEALALAALVTNPGSFATAALLGLLPLTEAGVIDLSRLVVDAKCGTTGAGRRAKVSLLASEVFGNFCLDSVGNTRHTPEIIQELSARGATGVRLTFTAHLLPIARGLLVTAYAPLADGVGASDAAERVRQALTGCYAGSPFVHVLERPEDVKITDVVGTNRCLISATVDPGGGQLVLVAAVDNLLKGDAGQAIQCANAMFGFAPTAGLGLGVGGAP